MNNPSDVEIDETGAVLIADFDSNRIRKVGTDGIITTIAGNGNYGYDGDGGAAIDASMRHPWGVAADGLGNTFTTNNVENVIRKIDSAGVITTIAGNGTRGYSGDGGPADQAQLNWPRGIDADEVGNVYFSDWQNSRIRKIDTNGIITTVAGNGVSGNSGDGGPATSASLRSPYDVAVGPTGKLFIADTSNNRVRQVDEAGIITTLASFSQSITAVDADSSGNVYVTNFENKVFQIDSAGVITTIAGTGTQAYSGDGGSPLLADLFVPTGVASDSSGSVYISTGRSNRIRKIGTIGNVADTTPPVVLANVSGELGENSWYIDDATISWTQDDPESQITETTGCTTEVVALDTVGDTFDCSATSSGGTTAESVTVKRDSTAPEIIISAPTDGATYTVGEAVAADFACSDLTAGIDTCAGTVPIGADIDTTTEGDQAFVVDAIDNAGNAATLQLTYTVAAGNSAPVAQPDSVVDIVEDSAATLVDVLANDTDPDGDPLSIESISDASGGITAIVGTTASYTPDPNFFGTDSFTYIATDGNGGSSEATLVTVQVDPVNDVPTLDTIADLSIEEDAGQQSVAMTGISAGPPNETQTLLITASSSDTAIIPNPVVDYTSPSATGSLLFTAEPDATGSATITVLVADDGGTANGGIDRLSRTFTVDVGTANNAPVAVDDISNADEDSENNAILVLQNDTDSDGDTLTVFSFTQPANGTTTSNGTVISYTPDPDYEGTDTFSYVAADGNGGRSDPATVTVNVRGINDAPNAVDDPSITTDEDVPVSIAVLDNDSDPENDPLTVASVTPVANGVTSTDGTLVTFEPAPNFSGIAAFVYTIVDGNGGTDSATVTVTVLGVNDNPVANDDVYTIDEDAVSVLPVRSNDTDADGDATTIATFSQGTLGTVNSSGDTLIYTPQLNVSGVDSFTYAIADGNGGSDTASVVVTILPVNDAPVADAGPDQNVLVNDLVTLDGSGTTDVDGPEIFYVWQFEQRPLGSSVTLANANSVSPTFTPDLAGDYLVNLIANDGIDASVADEIRITASSAPPTILFLAPDDASVDTNDSLTLTLTLDQPALAGGQLVSLVSDSSVINIPATVTVPEDEASVTFEVTTQDAPGTAKLTASAAGLVGDEADIQVDERTFSLAIPLIGINRSVVAEISLPRPAPVGGATFQLSVTDDNVATVSQTSVTISEGETQAEFDIVGGFAIGDTTVNVDGTATGYESKAVPITVTDRLIDLPTSAELSFGQIIDQQLLIGPEPAPVGGLPISVTSSDPSVVQVLTPNVTVPEGSFETLITIQADMLNSGQVQVTADNPSFSADSSTITVSRSLVILESEERIEVGQAEKTYIEISSGGQLYPAPPGGVAIAVSSDNTDCVAVTSPASVPENQSFAATMLTYGGVAAVPCTATVTATNPVFGTDAIPVTVETVADVGTLSLNATNLISQGRLGSGLQGGSQYFLSEPNHGGIVIQFESNDPATLWIAPDDQTAGKPVIEVFVPNGQTSGTLYLQGVRGAAGNASYTASSPSFVEGEVVLEVVPSGFLFSGLITDSNTLASDDEFQIRTFSTGTSGQFLEYQEASAVGPLTVTLTSSDPVVGGFTTQSQTASGTVTVDVPVGQITTPNTVANGGVAFDALANGTTTVTATAPGFDPLVSSSSAEVTVSQPAITVNTTAFITQGRLGSGLQRKIRVELGGADHGGVTVRLSSLDPSIARVSADNITAGSEFIDIVFADGESKKDVYAQGVRGATGSATLEATSALFATGTAALEVVPSGFLFSGLITDSNTLASDDEFQIRTFSTGTSGQFLEYQEASAVGPLTVTLTSSDPVVGGFTTQSQTASGTVTVDVPVGQITTPNTVANGGVAFDALANGTTTVTAMAPGFDPLVSSSSADVTVSQPAITFNVTSLIHQSRLGSGLQGRAQVVLDGADHGGVRVRVVSNTPTLMKVAPDDVTEGTSLIEIDIADGDTIADFYVQGERGATGVGMLTASNALFQDGTTTIEIVQPVVRINSLSSTISASDADDEFFLNIWSTSQSGSLLQNQNVSAVGPITFTLLSSDAGVGALKTLDQTSGVSVTIDIESGQSFTPTSIQAGGVAFDPLSAGETVISVTGPGFDPAATESSFQVSVTP